MTLNIQNLTKCNLWFIWLLLELVNWDGDLKRNFVWIRDVFWP